MLKGGSYAVFRRFFVDSSDGQEHACYLKTFPSLCFFNGNVGGTLVVILTNSLSFRLKFCTSFSDVGCSI